MLKAFRCTQDPCPLTLSFTQFMRRVDELGGVLQGRLLEYAVPQVHDVAVPVSRPVEDLLCPFPDELL